MIRDLVGRALDVPSGTWPNGARLAVSICINYEEGSERTFVLHEDDQETGTEWGNYLYPTNVRNLAMESMYEYGSRVGIWRILATIDELDVPVTFFACAQAVELNPPIADYLRANRQHEVCSHGYRWEEVFRLSREEEAEHIRLAIESFESTIGRRPVGWYCRYGPSIHTRELLAEEGGFLYDSDAYNDDAPYFVELPSGEHRLVVPYTPDVNDFRFWQANGPTTARSFTEYVVDSLQVLYRESEATPRMISFGLHPRIIGRPGRIESLRHFVEAASSLDGVWFATRREIAEAWNMMYPATRCVSQ